MEKHDLESNATAVSGTADMAPTAKLTEDPAAVTSAPPVKPSGGSSVGLAVASLAIAMTLASLNSTLVATMLPTIARELNGADNYAWVGTGYLLTSTALAPAWGKLSDIFGRKVVLQVNIVEFIAFTVMCAVAPSMIVLIIGRVFQGIGGGAILSMSFVIVGEISSPLELGKYMGMLGAITGLSAVIGPLLGGVLTDRASWHWGFWISVPVGVIALVGCQIALKLPRPKGTFRDQIRRVDFVGLFLLTSAVTLFLLGLSWGGTTYPWSSGEVIGCLVVAVVLAVAFVFWEHRAPEPIIPMRLFSDRNYVLAVLALTLAGFAMYALSYFVPIYFQKVLLMSATDSGINNMPLLGMLILASIGSGIYTNKTGQYRLFPTIGLVLAAVGMGLFSLLDETSSKGMQFGPQILAGAGLGFTITSAQMVAQINCHPSLIGPATTVANFVRLLGGVVGISVFATIVQNVSSSQLPGKLGDVAQIYHLTMGQIGLFAASLKSAYSSTPVDLSSISADALAALYLAVEQATVQGLRWAFIAGVPLVGIAVIPALFIRHIDLKTEAIVDVGATKDPIDVEDDY